MNRKERLRKSILDQVKAGVMSQREASQRLQLSVRQCRRVLARYRSQGDAGLLHRSRGRRSGRGFSPEVKEAIVKRYEERYEGFGPTFAAEKLCEDGYQVHAETLRLWLKEAGHWRRHRKRKAHHPHRARKLRFGELLQMDGSIHAWLPGVEGKQCLMNMVDDATGTTLSLLDTGETTRGAMGLLRSWVEKYGIPLAIYVDLKSLYVSPKQLREEESEVESGWLTHFSAVCEKLGIAIIKAYSPQAKGRVERSHGVYQDRFVKELKLREIHTIEAANEYLEKHFIEELNRKFAKMPGSAEDAHVLLLEEQVLDEFFCWEYTRQVKNNGTIQFENQHYQLDKAALLRSKQKVTIKRHLDGRLSFHGPKGPLMATGIESPVNVPKSSVKIDSQKRSQQARANKGKTPWSTFNPDWLGQKKTAANTSA